MNISTHQPVTGLEEELLRRLDVDVPGAAAAILELEQQWQDATSWKLATIGMPVMLCEELCVAVWAVGHARWLFLVNSDAKD